MQLQFVRMTSFSLIPFVFSKVKQAQKCLHSFSFMSDDRLGQTHLKSTNLVIWKQWVANGKPVVQGKHKKKIKIK